MAAESVDQDSLVEEKEYSKEDEVNFLPNDAREYLYRTASLLSPSRFFFIQYYVRHF